MTDTSGKLMRQDKHWRQYEASPAVFGDTLVVGTRGQKIYGIKIGPDFYGNRIMGKPTKQLGSYSIWQELFLAWNT